MMSIDNADVEGMQESADKLNAGKYYGLMACMITGRSWQAIINGIYRTPRTSSEVKLTYLFWCYLTASCLSSGKPQFELFVQ